MKKLIVTTLAIAIHRDGENPLFGESAIRVELQDEGGGCFLEISNNSASSDGVQIDLDELELVTQEAKKMVAEYEKNEQVTP